MRTTWSSVSGLLGCGRHYTRHVAPVRYFCRRALPLSPLLRTSSDTKDLNLARPQLKAAADLLCVVHDRG